MKGDQPVIDILNDVLTAELTSINQYFVHAEMCHNWGYERLYKHIRAESIDEMRHAHELIERILYLEGLPNVQKLNKVTIGQTVPEQLALDLELEKDAVVRLNIGIPKCHELGDAGTRELLEEILEKEEEHVDWIEAQLDLIEQVGVQNYLAAQIRVDES